MKRIGLIHIGPGRVGKNLIAQIASCKSEVKSKYDLDISYNAIVNRSGTVVSTKGFSIEELRLFSIKGIGGTSSPHIRAEDVIGSLDTSNNYNVLVDTSDSETTTPIMLKILKAGGYVVMSNKNPLSAPIKDFEKLWRYKPRIFFETTVGAGLPVISTIKNLMLSGDRIVDVKGCFSGTLNFIFSEIENGYPFSLAVAEAVKKGFTEPHPKDDLSGKDVARKTLILNRLLGGRKEIEDIKQKRLYGKELESLDPVEFVASLKKYDNHYRAAGIKASIENKTPRFTAAVTDRKINIGVHNVLKSGDLGALDGPDNMVIITTERYKNPIVIKGPGAGPEVTATGVFGDILSLAGII